MYWKMLFFRKRLKFKKKFGLLKIVDNFSTKKTRLVLTEYLLSNKRLQYSSTARLLEVYCLRKQNQAFFFIKKYLTAYKSWQSIFCCQNANMLSIIEENNYVFSCPKIALDSLVLFIMPTKRRGYGHARDSVLFILKSSGWKSSVSTNICSTQQYLLYLP